MAALLSFLRALLLAVLLFPVGLATHEVIHLAVYSALGIPAVLLVTHWRPGLAGPPLFGLHAAPVGPGGLPLSPADVPLGPLVTNNGLGPALAALLLFVLWLAVGRPSRAARAALLANVLALVFFSVIEMAYPLLEEVGHVGADVLLLPEVNYGSVLLIFALVAAAATWLWRPSHRLRLEAGRPAPPTGRSGPPGRLPAR